MRRTIWLGVLLGGLGSVALGCTASSESGAGGNGGTSTASGAAGAGAGGTTAGGAGGVGGTGVGGTGTGGAAGSTTGGTGGTGASGSGCPETGELDLHLATVYDNPTGLADWPIGTTITDLEFQYNGADGVHVEFDKRDGPNSWPDVTPPGWDGPLEYTLGMAECIDGQWYASAAIQFWRGLDAWGGNVALNDQIAANWYYEPAWWGELAGRQPATGEIIGMFVVAGNARHVTDEGSQSPVKERSNVVLVPMPDVSGAVYTF
jgi:hypothetical protein